MEKSKLICRHPNGAECIIGKECDGVVYCRALKNTDFKGKTCSFFKSEGAFYDWEPEEEEEL